MRPIPIDTMDSDSPLFLNATTITYIPREHPSRTLVLCFDGTNNKISQKNSNVAQFFSLLKKDDLSKQIVHYQTGIGTYTSNGIGPIFSTIAKATDSLLAWGIASHVKDGYEFLMQHYDRGDRICIFGFSRGAYTARALAGMIHKVGLLPRSNIRHIIYAYKVFERANEEGWKQAKEFKRCFCIDVDIEFVGIWDSVGSIGINGPGLPFSDCNTTIKTFRHALALDERRALFKANAWRCFEATRCRDPKDHSDVNTECAKPGRLKKQSLTLTPGKSLIQHTDVEEVWFVGSHSDVGGGSVPSGTRHALSRISLRWMVRECFKANTGILFKPAFLRELGIHPENLDPIVRPRPPPLFNLDDPPAQKGVNEEVEEYHDALSPIYDRLKSAPLWWALEVIPWKQKYVNADGQWSDHFILNLGRPRILIPQQQAHKVHRSVKTRMDDVKSDYRPYVVNPIWVD